MTKKNLPEPVHRLLNFVNIPFRPDIPGVFRPIGKLSKTPTIPPKASPVKLSKETILAPYERRQER